MESKSRRFRYLGDKLDDDVDTILNTSIESEDEYNDLQGEGMKIIPLLKHTETLTVASNLLDKLYKIAEIETEQ